MKTISNTARRAAQAAFALFLAAGAGQAGAMDLVEAYSQALHNDPAALAADEALTAGREKAVQGNALLRPRINLQAGASRINNRSSADLPAPLSGLAPSNTNGTVRQASVQLVQPLYDKAAGATRRQLREQSELARTQFDHSRESLALRVADAYFGVLVAEETLRVVQAEKRALGQQRDRAKARFDVGQGKITDLQEAQARLDGVEAREVSATSTLELRRASYRETIGVAPDRLSALAPTFAAQPPLPDDLTAWQMRGEDRNTVVKTRQSELEIAGAEIDKFRLASRPTLNLVAGYGTEDQNGNLSPLVAREGNRTALIGLQLNIPIYAGGGIDSREREAAAKRRQAEQELAAARRDVRLQVQDGFLAVKTGVSRIAALEQALVSARSALESTTLGRDVGTRTQPDVLDAQQRMYTAELNLIQARVDYLMGRLRLEAAAGELNEDSLRALSAWLAS
ncbi:Outer membrane protein TolC [Cupriavidus yeoncheonensis]|uniref:Outer membrane protein TolC n=1 Tax=Cupriavidus yeoncheonensis TaxID=1462994 RepID=A0A916J1W3_9BURK|nr:TolC family outer membrane protein [Cupriavidus yeoncheonensis]CAG2155116.1 Outer membrane protein TolC [Cupriavidus yeoncheonensis]